MVLAWRSVPKAGFLYRLAKIIHAHQLGDPKSRCNLCRPLQHRKRPDRLSRISTVLHGKAAWEEADIDDFLREIALTKFFEIDDPVGTTFVQTKASDRKRRASCPQFHQFRPSGSRLCRSRISIPLNHIVDGFCRHPELDGACCAKRSNRSSILIEKTLPRFLKQKEEVVDLIENLDTGQAVNDLRRKNILRQGVQFLDCILEDQFLQAQQNEFQLSARSDLSRQCPLRTERKIP